MSYINTNKVVKTALLPGIVPRLSQLTTNTFSTLAYLVALLYTSVKLLPPGHPFSNPANQGRFGLRDVIFEASSNLKFDRKHSDQIIIFFTIGLGLVVLIAQALLLLATVMFQTAWASSAGEVTFGSLFQTVNPEKDMAFSLLDQVFAIPGVFGSEYDPALNGYGISPFHTAMHRMLAFYSYAMLMIGVFIVCYYILVAIFETAQSGVPFGQRFDSVWAPVRLVVALFLLVPLSYGLNSAQYMTLYAAKYGSGLATNGWSVFMQTMVNETGEGLDSPFGYQSRNNERIYFYKNTYLDTSGLDLYYDITTEEERYRRAMLAVPQLPDMKYLTNYLTILSTCVRAYDKLYGKEIGAYFVSNEVISAGGASEKFAVSAAGKTYEEALAFYNSSDIIVRFGERDPEEYREEKGNVKPLCGELKYIIKDKKEQEDGVFSPAGEIQKRYFQQISAQADSMVLGSAQNGGKIGLGEYFAARNITDGDTPESPVMVCKRFNGEGGSPYLHPLGLDLKINTAAECSQTPLPDAVLAKQLLEVDKQWFATALLIAYVLALDTTDIGLSDEIMERGWSGAGIWYNTIAQLNGSFTAAAASPPKVNKLPHIMTEVQQRKEQKEHAGSIENKFEPYILQDADSASDRKVVFDDDPQKQQLAEALNESYELYSSTYEATDRSSVNVGFFFQMVNSLLGSEGLYTIRENVQVHPLAQITSLGRSMIDAALRNLAMSAGSGILGGALGMFDKTQGAGAALQGVSGFFSAFAGISLTVGIMLYYIVPFLPFIFFFFAVFSWVKTIFEAMVGVPLWALAHLRIQGNGLPGQAASGGYFLLLEIFLRPILIVFGLLAASIIFFTEVYLLHITYDLVVENLAGADPGCAIRGGSSENSTGCANDSSLIGGTIDQVRGQVDVFFFTVMYTIFIYIMANSTFKLVDAIPNEILRWMGSATETFTANTEDPTQNLTRSAGIGGAIVGRQIAGSFPSMFGKTGQGAGQGASQMGLNMAATR